MSYSMKKTLTHDDDREDIAIVYEYVYGAWGDTLGGGFVGKHVDKRTGQETPLYYAEDFPDLLKVLKDKNKLKEVVTTKGLDWAAFEKGYRVGGADVDTIQEEEE
jgi:hypothetical protein